MTSSIDAATGYLELGMIEDANSELEKLPPEVRAREDVLLLRVRIYSSAGSWDSASMVAQHLTKSDPANADYWRLWVHALRRWNPEEGERALIDAEQIYPHVAILHFGLACYASRAGRVAEAKCQLDRAFKLDPTLRLTALDEEDLLAVWA